MLYLIFSQLDVNNNLNNVHLFLTPSLIYSKMRFKIRTDKFTGKKKVTASITCTLDPAIKEALKCLWLGLRSRTCKVTLTKVVSPPKPKRKAITDSKKDDSEKFMVGMLVHNNTSTVKL